MGNVDGAIARLQKSHERVVKADAARETAMRARDEDVRKALAAGATWDAITDATGMSTATIRKARARG